MTQPDFAKAAPHVTFHNVTFFDGGIADLPELLQDEEG
jgi:hypothetical protein